MTDDEKAQKALRIWAAGRLGLEESEVESVTFESVVTDSYDGCETCGHGAYTDTRHFAEVRLTQGRVRGISDTTFTSVIVEISAIIASL